MPATNTKQRGFANILAVVAVAVSTLIILLAIALLGQAINVARSGGCTLAQALQVFQSIRPGEANNLFQAICDTRDEGYGAEGYGGIDGSYPVGKHSLTGQFTKLVDIGVPLKPGFGPDEPVVDTACIAAAQQVYLLLSTNYESSANPIKATGAYDPRGRTHKSSSHKKGFGLDFARGTLNKATAPQATAEILKSGWASKVLDEYNRPSAGATGGHLHVELHCSPAAQKSIDPDDIDIALGIVAPQGKLQTSCSAYPLPTPILSKEGSNDIKNWVKQAADRWLGGDQAMLVALIQKESSWVPDAKPKSSSALGLGQFLIDTARDRVEFMGGSDQRGGIWTAGGGISGGANDPRRDVKRSIFAAAHYLNDAFASTKQKECAKIASADDRLACAYKWGYHRGCNTSTNSATCREAEKAEVQIAAIYRTLHNKNHCTVTSPSASPSTSPSSTL